VPRIDSNESHAKRMCYNRVKAAARQGPCLSSLLAYFFLLFVDRLCRAPFVLPVFSFPKEYIDVLKGTFLNDFV